MILAIDPGTTQSALLIYDPAQRKIIDRDFADNAKILLRLRCMKGAARFAVIEEVASYGMPVGREVFQTVYWSGRFYEALEHCGVAVSLLPRLKVKTHLCHSAKAKDGNIRQALIDYFGGETQALGGVKCEVCKGRKLVGRGKLRGPCLRCEASGWLHPPGPLADISSHLWAALALAVTSAETRPPPVAAEAVRPLCPPAPVGTVPTETRKNERNTETRRFSP